MTSKTITYRCAHCGEENTKTYWPTSQKPPRFCGRACSLAHGRESAAWTEATQRYLHSDRNPFNDPAVAAKAQLVLRERGYPELNGGNGKLTVPQQLLAARLGWTTEFVMATGLKPPYPRNYKIDVASDELSIAIEVDGQSHHGERQRRIDDRKDSFLRQHGWIVLRFTNEEVLTNLDEVVRQVIACSTSKRPPETT